MSVSETSVLDRVAGIISRHSMAASGQTVGVAVSGGADSVCLLYVLRELTASLGLTLKLIHLNHQLRADESDKDEAFVRELGGQLGYPVLVRAEAVGESGGNLEEAGREARHRFYRELMANGDVSVVATGHTRSDQAETVLYRLLRGSGMAGLSGVRPVTKDGVIRPLLDCNREEVETYLRERNICWREDSSNRDPSFVRNRIRHSLLPQLRSEYNPALPQALAQLAVLAQDEERYWVDQIDRLASKLLAVQSSAVLLSCSELLTLPRAVARRLLRRAIEETKGDLRSIDFEHVEALLNLAAGGEGHGRLQLPGLDIFRSFDRLRITQPRSGSRADRDYQFILTLPAAVRIPGGVSTIYLDLLEFPSCRPVDRAERGYTESGSLLDLGSVEETLELRNWRPGDCYSVEGRSSGKIKLLFQQERVPIWDRQGWPVLTSGGRIVWARKFGPAAEVAPGPKTSRVVRVAEIADAGLEGGG
jgi:tRNA(Ile)-lysidine synthase